MSNSPAAVSTSGMSDLHKHDGDLGDATIGNFDYLWIEDLGIF